MATTRADRSERTNAEGRGEVVVCSTPELGAAAAVEAERLGLRVADDPAEGELALVLDDGGWALLDPAPGAPGAVRCDLVEGGLGERLREGARGESRLARALGLKRHPDPVVLDATAGLGRESAIAAALGCRVIACERSPIVALLLRDGLERASRAGLAEVVARIDLRMRDAREVLAELAAGERPDVVLVDPMFPERRKAAAAKKEMQLLQHLLPPESDAESLLDAALQGAARRVVVKRPVHAPPVGTRRPDLQVPGRAARYDVYLRG